MAWTKSLSTRVRDSFLLGASLRTVQHRDAPQQHAVRKYSIRGQRLLAAARTQEFEAALPLYRDAVANLMAAALVAHDRTVDPPTLSRSEIWKRWLALELSPGCRDLLQHHQSLLDSDLVCADLPSDSAQRMRMAAEIEGAIRMMLQATESRSLTHLRLSRLVRIVAPIAIVLFVLVKAVVAIAGPRNLAKGKPTLQSSKHPSAKCAPGDLTNGSIESAYGIHTATESNPWVMVDLGVPQPVGKIVVYNRGDGWFDESLPLVLEIGDRESGPFFEVGARKQSFSQRDPWVTAGIGRTARYVRVRKPVNGYIALAEIEVYKK